MDERMQAEESTLNYFISGTNSVAHSRSQQIQNNGAMIRLGE
jgi:hypothetical protein